MAVWDNPYIDKLADYPQYILNPVVNLNWAEVFGNNNKLAVDIGCGAGNFLVHQSQINPDINYIGLELRYKRLVYSASKLLKRGITNVRLLRYNANNIASLFNDSSLSEVYINFPDPWPKKRHHKNRLISNQYCLILKKLLTPNGFIHFKTDYQQYFEEAKIIFSNYFTIDDSVISIIENSSETSEFEQLFINQNKQIYQLRLVNTG